MSAAELPLTLVDPIALPAAPVLHGEPVERVARRGAVTKKRKAG